MHFLLTRPEEDSQKLAQTLKGLGHLVSITPLLKINYFDQQEINLDNFQSILFTSANGVRAFIRNNQNRSMACYAVGDATTTEAKEAGFEAVFSAGGDVNKLADLVIRTLKPQDGSLLHVSGQDTAGNLSGILEDAGFHISREQLYKAAKASVLSETARELITSGKITHIPLYSPRTAKAFAQLIRAAELQGHLTEITALCLSSAVSDVIRSLKWQTILTASQPDQYNLFNMINVKLEENRQ
ncbi:MAG: uroporphyrinogen-III synthase [Emcibacter sp.]|nr:uroporphyrinogen-III synthase [Emcibacter sp.]